MVARPLDCGLEEEPGIELQPDIPARLVERLRSGEIDVALVSSIELFRQPGYRFLDGLAVAGRGFVASVQVFLRKPLEEIRNVAMDPASRAAATLVRVMLAEREPAAPTYLECERDQDPRSLEADAWLRIGDRALQEYHEPNALSVFNPSQAWTEHTGLPFIFATWIVRPGVDLTPWLDAFHRARERGEARRPEFAAQASQLWNLPPEAAREYLLEECVYEPGPAMHEALRTFRDRAAALSLCDGQLDPEPIEDTSPHAS
jgi:chorismate dehydratase